jgi:AcrR family transcriptional regulator
MATALGRREATKERNRAAILGAARAAFAANGYGGTAVRDIVRRTDLSPGTFYNYFPDKESIFLALVEESTSRIRARLREARRDAQSVEDFVTCAYRAWFSAIADDPAMFELLRRNAGTVRAMLDDALLAAGVDELLEDLDAAIATGDLPPLDARYMARAMAGVALEVGMEMLERRPVDVDGAAAFAGNLFLGGIERLAQVHNARTSR